MTEQLSPEQRAAEALPCTCETVTLGSHRLHDMTCPARRIDRVASAIRAAETAAVEAERARCAQLARQSDKGQDLTGDELADLILSTEATHG